MPGIQLLHCLVNETSGGLSTLVDGFAVARRCARRIRPAFDVLTGTPVRFKYLDAQTELTASAPPIELDVTGAVKSIHFSPRLDFVPLFEPQRLRGLLPRPAPVRPRAAGAALRDSASCLRPAIW